jgi:cellulose synthase operon protein C
MKTKLSKMLFPATAACLALLLVACSTPEEKAQGYYDSGKTLLDKQDFARASVEFRNALKIKKDHAESWFGMAQVEEHAQNWSAMMGDLNKVIEINPNHVKAYQTLAKFNMVSGDFATALKNINYANDKEPNNPDIIAVKAVILLKLNDAKGARAETDKALGINPIHVDANIVLASLQLNEGNDAAALTTAEKTQAGNPPALGLFLVKLKVFEKRKDIKGQESVIRDIVKSFPDQKQYKSGLILFLIKNGRADDAEKELRAELSAKPNDKASAAALISLLRQTKGEAAARAQLVELASASEEPFDYVMQIADIDYANGQKEKAYGNLKKLVTELGVSDDGIAARISLAEKLLDDKQLSEAESQIAEVLKNDSLNANGLKLSGILELAKGNKDKSIEILRQALNSNADDPSIHVFLASSYESKASFDLAAKELSDAFRLSNGNADIGLSFANFLMRRGNKDRAQDVLSEVVSRYPSRNDAITLLANIKLQKQDWKGAEELARMIQANKGDAGLSNQIMGASMVGQQRFDDAISFYQNSVATAPNDVQPMYALVRSYIGAGKQDEAKDFVASMIKANPNNASAYILMSIVNMTQSQPDLAQKNLETAIALDKASPSGYLALAQFYFDQKDTDKSIATLTTAIAEVKQNEALRMVLGGIYEADNRFDNAIEQYQAVVNEDPNSVVAVNNLVSLISDYKTDEASLKRAVELASVLKESPIPQFRETLGWILVQSGDVKAGLPILEQGISKLDNYGMAHYHIGVAYAKAGDKIPASEHLNRALALEKNTGNLAKIVDAMDAVKTGKL